MADKMAEDGYLESGYGNFFKVDFIKVVSSVC